jgi:uncharacterized protein (TIGR00251 family)
MDSSLLRIRETGSGIDVPLHVQPRARRSMLAGVYDGALKLKVTAPPVDQAANRAVVEFFAALLEIPRSRIKIISGEKTRGKTLRLDGIRLQDFLNRVSGS